MNDKAVLCDNFSDNYHHHHNVEHLKFITFSSFFVDLLSICLCNMIHSVSSVPCGSISIAGKSTIRDGRIVGGTNAVRGSIPYIASLTRRGGHFCG